ncbi:MAG: hypothetical protein ACFFD1_03750 [Candidatus Thorarchaeota archaeon]
MPEEKQLKKYQIDFGEKGIYDTRNRINDFTGKQWTFSTKSVITKNFVNFYPEFWLYKYPGILPIDLLKDLILTFSKKGYLIFDPFAFLGNTIFAWSTIPQSRSFFFKNLNEDLYTQLFKFNPLNYEKVKLNVREHISENVDLIISQIITQSTNISENNKEKVKLNDFHGNLDNIISRISSNLKFLKPDKYGIFSFTNKIISEKNVIEKHYIEIGSKIKLAFEMHNLILKAELIWLQPYISCNSTNDTRIYIFQKSDVKYE